MPTAVALIPRKRPFAIYDATISYPLRGDTIPALVAIIIPFILMLISLFVGEFILFKKVRRCCFLLHCFWCQHKPCASQGVAWLHMVTLPIERGQFHELHQRKLPLSPSLLLAGAPQHHDGGVHRAALLHRHGGRLPVHHLHD